MFGFPASSGSPFDSDSIRQMYGSLADLGISSTPVKSGGSNGLCPVFVTKCSQQTLRQELTELEPLGETRVLWIEDETAAAPFAPASKQTVNNYSLSEHGKHKECEAKALLGFIWLDVQ